MNMETLNAISEISDEEWQQIILDLGWYAVSVSRRLRWRTKNPIDLPRGETVDSIVSKALEKLFSGDREWHPKQDPDIKRYLMGVVDSLLNHLAESKDNTLLTRTPEPDSADAPAWESGSSERDPATDWLVPARHSPETEMLEEERTRLENRALELLIDECSDDQLLLKVLEAKMDGHDKPAEIAKAVGISIQEMYNATKRLDRKLEKVRAQIANE
jgi:hypothetical protein